MYRSLFTDKCLHHSFHYLYQQQSAGLHTTSLRRITAEKRPAKVIIGKPGKQRQVLNPQVH